MLALSWPRPPCTADNHTCLSVRVFVRYHRKTINQKESLTLYVNESVCAADLNMIMSRIRKTIQKKYSDSTKSIQSFWGPLNLKKRSFENVYFNTSMAMAHSSVQTSETVRYFSQNMSTRNYYKTFFKSIPILAIKIPQNQFLTCYKKKHLNNIIVIVKLESKQWFTGFSKL